jgi:hypothetical protein
MRTACHRTFVAGEAIEFERSTARCAVSNPKSRARDCMLVTFDSLRLIPQRRRLALYDV